MAQLGRALRSGRRGRRFKSFHPDQTEAPTGHRNTILFEYNILNLHINETQVKTVTSQINN